LKDKRKYLGGVAKNFEYTKNQFTGKVAIEICKDISDKGKLKRMESKA
jgi:hypothetical protein